MVHRKPDEERIRRNKPRYLQQVLTWDGIKRGPNLPDGYHWCDETKRWYEDFRSSPNAMLTEDSDWEHILVAAQLHNRLWMPEGTWTGSDGRVYVAKGLSPSEMSSISKELRTRMAPYGYTNEDRLRLNVFIGDAENDPDAPVMIDNSIDYESLLKEK